jgi:hypothetical protein
MPIFFKLKEFEHEVTEETENRFSLCYLRFLLFKNSRWNAQLCALIRMRH